MQSISKSVAVIVLLLCCLIVAVTAKKSVFSLQVLEDDGVGEWEVTFSMGSLVLGHSVSGQGKLQRNFTEKERAVFDAKFNCHVGDEELTGDALLELIPAGTVGYDVAVTAGLRSASGLSAAYLLQANRLFTCPRLVLNHNLTTIPDHLFAFSSQLTETCESKNKSQIAIEVNVSSSVFPIITTSLQQVFAFDGPNGWEWMNATNPAIDVAVTAEWQGINESYRHKKTAKFQSKIPSLPTFALEYMNQADRIVFSVLKQLPNNGHDEL
jgi:hypothetical protein